MEIKNLLDRLYKINKEIMLLAGVYNLLDWDRAVLMPNKAAEQRADQLSMIMLQLHEKMTSKELNEIIRELSKKENFNKLNDLQKALVKRHEWKLARLNKIPKEHVEEFSKIIGLATHNWEKAKEKNDFELFRPYLEKIVAMKIKEARYIDDKRHPYDVLLEDYERGMNINRIDAVFKDLKKGIIEILNNVKKTDRYKKNNNNSLNRLDFPQDMQQLTSQEVSTMILGDKDRFIIAKSMHPFMTTIGPDDMRITTAFRAEPFFSFSSTVHESGHALYESNFSPELRDTILYDAPSLGIHESQSRIWENQICRGENFWKYYYRIYKQRFDSLKNIKFEEFYKMINIVKPSLIRIEADELTYCLHVIIRYEIEISLMEGKLSVKDLPKAWNAKYKEYLGIEPKNNSQGLLQDVHWSQGMLGYFPTYALGTIYSAMLYNQMKKENPRFEDQISKGNLDFMKKWLKEHIHKYGASRLTPEIIRNACKSELDSRDILEYFRKKFYEIYEIRD